MQLRPHQEKAAKQLDSGKILYGGVGSGKSATVLAYYMAKQAPKDIYVITTARKRDTLDWVREAANFGIGMGEYSVAGKLHVDSWNNIDKYIGVENAFFIFDEQRLVGSGAWVKSFLKLAKTNTWVLLSATPGDTWMDYVPVFLANGFYKNVTEFKYKHVVYEPYVKFPIIRAYLGERKLEMLRNEILVEMPFASHTERIPNWIDVGHDEAKLKRVYKDRWHIYEDRPIKDVGEMWRVMRRIVFSDPSRLDMVRKLMMCHPQLIVFYNFDYELEILRTLKDEGLTVYEWNGHRKQELPEDETCVYLVQYVAGAEAWNCTSTDGMVMYSLTYSYKNFEQAQGRIDRMDTPYTNLYYYFLVSNTMVDKAIRKSLDAKENFNERRYLREMELL